VVAALGFTLAERTGSQVVDRIAAEPEPSTPQH